MQDRIRNYLDETKKCIDSIGKSTDQIALACRVISTAVKSGNKLLIAGNGGSAADAQHIAAEFVGRFRMERKPYAAIALNTNSSILTSVGNDYSFNDVFSRQVEALGREGDVFLAITTSGNSVNILQALETSKKKGISTILLSAGSGGKAAAFSDILILPDSTVTSHIQESHQIIYHIICSAVEEDLC